MSAPRESKYGAGFDNLAERWAFLENEHDRMHPDRSDCGGVGGCPMMAAAVDLEHRMIEVMESWRSRVRFDDHQRLIVDGTKS